jgi:hypothetical protein
MKVNFSTCVSTTVFHAFPITTMHFYVPPMACHFKHNPCYKLILMPKKRKFIQSISCFSSTEVGM